MTRSDAPGYEHFGFKDGISQPGVAAGLCRLSQTLDVRNKLKLDGRLPRRTHTKQATYPFIIDRPVAEHPVRGFVPRRRATFSMRT